MATHQLPTQVAIRMLALSVVPGGHHVLVASPQRSQARWGWWPCHRLVVPGFSQPKADRGKGCRVASPILLPSQGDGILGCRRQR